MNFLVGVLLMYLPKEEDAYSAMMLLMQQRQLRELYKTDLAALQVQYCTALFYCRTVLMQLWQLRELCETHHAALHVLPSFSLGMSP